MQKKKKYLYIFVCVCVCVIAACRECEVAGSFLGDFVKSPYLIIKCKTKTKIKNNHYGWNKAIAMTIPAILGSHDQKLTWTIFKLVESKYLRQRFKHIPPHSLKNLFF